MDGPTTLAERETLDDVLLHGALEIVGRITEASNVALLVDVDGGPDAGGVRAMYKPVRGERPLWDFPDGTLAGRETASALIAEATGYAVVPPTVLREGPLGLGSVQLWIGDPYAAEPVGADRQPVRLVPVGAVPPGWLAVIDGRLPDGREVTVIHEDAPDLRDAAVLDAIVNNSDRKGGHLVRDSRGTLWGFDHGLTLHTEPKLRTVLWGWAGQPLRPRDVERLSQLAERLDEPGEPLVGALAELLPRGDLGALGLRVRQLAVGGIHPLPHPGWPSIPWPAL
ncbi:MAG: SCO1664 family protein [Actinomycetales bacterium]|nr:SCO1664 family protein [Actinomycetales bacterium]